MIGGFKKFVPSCVRDLPPLSWLAIVDGSPLVTVLHGSLVEMSDDFFVEGAWSGDYSRGNLADCDCMFGSGGQIRDGTLLFVTSIATTDYVFYYEHKGIYLVSNSLPLVLWRAEDGLDPLNFAYSNINQSIVEGLRRHIRDMPTQNGVVRRVMHFNLRFSGQTPSLVDKRLPPPFGSFSDYDTYLRSCCERLFENARDPARRQKVTVYSTQSTGYDSTAINAIVRDYGVDAVFTIQQGKGSDTFANHDAADQVDDDGAEIARLLDLNVIQVSRREFEDRIPRECLFWAGMHRNGDMNFVGIHKHIRAPALLLTGTLGEIWYPTSSAHPEALDDELVRGDLSCHGLSEVRTDIGYVQCAIPYIGARRRKDIVNISDSDEMEPWRLHSRYDRPIPRRIGEDAGVPRNVFGQRKSASVVDFPPPDIPFGQELRREYFEFLRTNHISTELGISLFPLIHRYNEFATYRTQRNKNIAGYYLDRGLRKITRGRIGLERAWGRLNGSVFCFAVNKRIVELADVLGTR
jgi:hypothetical protein